MSIKNWIFIFFGLTLLPFGSSVFAQGINTTFGQNRVQYGRFEWSFLRTENYDAFFYSGGREIANFCIKYAENNMPSIEKLLDHRLAGRIEIICYNTLGDYKQSNYGLDEVALNTGGYTNVVNNRVLIYFNGDHADLVRQLKEGLALVLLNELLYGGSVQERLQNAALLNLPQWYLQGLTSYMSVKWDVDMDNKMKDALEVKGKFRFNKLSQKDPVFAGHSLWRYLVEKYGDEFIANMVYITKLTRNYESAFFYVTNIEFSEIQKEYLDYYKNLYSKESSLLQEFPSGEYKIKKRIAPYVQSQMKASPKGNYLAFTTNKYGKYRIWLMDLKTGKTKRVFKGGIKYNQLIIDQSFPLLAWQAGGDKLAYVYEKKSQIYLRIVDLVNKKEEKIKFNKFDKVTGIDFSENGRSIVLSAIRKGQSDIYVYDVPTRKERQITTDFYDDLHPRFVDFSGKILFSSNRKGDSLGVGIKSSLEDDNNFDIFQYDLETNSRKLKRLTHTPNINETQPIDYNKNYFAYLTEYNGVRNRYAVRLEEVYDYTELQVKYFDSLEIVTDTLIYTDAPTWSGTKFNFNGKDYNLDSRVERIDTLVHNKDIVYTYPLTNYKKSIIAHDISVQGKQVFDLVLDKGRYYIKYGPILKNIESEAAQVESYPNMYRLQTGYATKPFEMGAKEYRDKPTVLEQESEVKEIKVKVDTNAYFFINEFTQPNYKRPEYIVITKNPELNSMQKSIKVNAPRFYDVTFFTDKVITQIDNSIINTYYQPISPAAQQMFNPGLNGMFKLGMIDLFEDYRITGGVRLAFDLSGFDYFASFETLKKKLDHKFVFYRQSRSSTNSELINYKNLSHELRYIIKIPINPVISFRFSTFYRQDRDITKTTDVATLDSVDKYTHWMGGKFEFVFDNTVPKGMNLYHGTRFKVFYEHYSNIKNLDLQLNTLGFDFRHYQKIHRQIIWATRFTANTSFGPGRVVYYLGGVENWLPARFNNEIATATDKNYVFQALACNLRGFEQNIRNGNSFALINSEIRVPIFQYALNKTLRSEFLNNFQLVPFFDIGSAWVGSNPYSDDNTFNQKEYINGPIKAKVINVRDPIVAGFGGGLRTKLFGYFLRFDSAWGIQDSEVAEKPIYYFSLGLDF
ncbi:MAG: PD40 domain-containing protein [Bacteroidia bacterium]|nr:PD40 domain-containing protein [Bacteroidia bacterium]